MRIDLDRLFKEIPERRPSPALLQRIVMRVALARRRRAYLRGLGAGMAAAVSIVGLFISVRYALDEIYLSGFAQYAELLMGNVALAGNLWQQFAWSLVESVPIVSLVLCAASAAALLWSLSRMIRSVADLRSRTVAA